MDIRHDATHTILPSLELSRVCVSKALEWLRANYWEKQLLALESQAQTIESQIQEVLSAPTTDEDLLSEIVSSVSPNSVQSLLVGAMLRPGCFLPPAPDFDEAPNTKSKAFVGRL